MLRREMPYFKDADDVYAHLGRLMQDLASDAEFAPALERADTTLQMRLRQPDATITVRTPRGEEPAQVDLGQTSLQPEVILQMDADLAHRLWLGSVNPAVVLANGDIRSRGPAAKILGLIPLVKPTLQRYRAQLEEAGREDLLEAAA